MEKKITYKDVIQELREKFGENKFHYFNDKRKEFRRIKIYGRSEYVKKKIHNYLKRKYGKELDINFIITPKQFPSRMYYNGPTIKFPL